MSSQEYLLASGIVATGTTQATAFPLLPAPTYHLVATTPLGTGVMLPVASNGTLITVVNQGINTLLVYPQPKGTISGGGLNQPVSVPSGLSMQYATTDGLNFQAITDTSGSVPITGAPNNTIVTNSSGMIVAGGPYGATGGIANQFMMTDSKGVLNASQLTASTVSASTATVSGAINAGSLIASGNITAAGGTVTGTFGAQNALFTGVVTTSALPFNNVITTNNGGILTGAGGFSSTPTANQFVTVNGSGATTIPTVNATTATATTLNATTANISGTTTLANATVTGTLKTGLSPNNVVATDANGNLVAAGTFATNPTANQFLRVDSTNSATLNELTATTLYSPNIYQSSASSSFVTNGSVEGGSFTIGDIMTNAESLTGLASVQTIATFQAFGEYLMTACNFAANSQNTYTIKNTRLVRNATPFFLQMGVDSSPANSGPFLLQIGTIDRTGPSSGSITFTIWNMGNIPMNNNNIYLRYGFFSSVS